MTQEMKNLIWEIISDLDSHFPDDALTDEYYERFFNKYIKPCIDKFIEENKNDAWKMINGEVA